MKRIGVISDTHGLLRAEAVAALRDSDLILHGGDVGEPGILDDLREVAPVWAVRGNVDRGAWAERLPETEVVEVEGVSIYMLHDLGELDLNLSAAGFRVVVFGHSHRPEAREEGGVLYLNPGAAGPRRFSLPVSVARVVVDGPEVSAELVEL